MPVDIAGLIFYVLGAGYFIKFSPSVKSVALFVGIGAAVAGFGYDALMAAIHGWPLESAFPLHSIVARIVQLALAFVIFRLVEKYEESITATFVVLFLGAFVSYITVPNLTTTLLQ